MAHAVEATERGKYLVTALRVLAHTSQVDPEYFQECVKVAGGPVATGFHAMLEQNDKEFLPLLEHMRGSTSVLEIGSRYGKSLECFAHCSAPGARIVAVDLPYADHGGQTDPAPILRQTISDISRTGREAHLIIGDSHDPKVVEMVRQHGPFDFVFIDGDHSYEGVKADWENYGPMAKKIVAFHDIINNTGCFRLWNEVKTGQQTVEYTDSLWLGIGVLFKQQGA